MPMHAFMSMLSDADCLRHFQVTVTAAPVVLATPVADGLPCIVDVEDTGVPADPVEVNVAVAVDVRVAIPMPVAPNPSAAPVTALARPMGGDARCTAPEPCDSKRSASTTPSVMLTISTAS